MNRHYPLHHQPQNLPRYKGPPQENLTRWPPAMDARAVLGATYMQTHDATGRPVQQADLYSLIVKHWKTHPVHVAAERRFQSQVRAPGYDPYNHTGGKMHRRFPWGGMDTAGSPDVTVQWATPARYNKWA